MERFRKLGTQDGAHKNGIWCLDAFSNDGRETLGDFITGGSDGKLKTWRIRTAKEMTDDEKERDDDGIGIGPCVQLRSLSGHSLPIVAVAVARDSSTAVSTSLDGVVNIWNLTSEDGESKSIKHILPADTWGVAVSSDGTKAVTGGANGVVKIIDTTLSTVDETFSIGQNDRDVNESLRREQAMVLSVALSPDNTRVAVGAHDGSVTVLDVETGKAIGGKLAKHGGPVRSIGFLPTEPNTILTGSDDQLINLYDIDSGHVTGTCRGHSGLVLSARGSGDGRYLVSGGSDRSVRVWDRMLKESVYSFKGHKDSVWGVDYAVGGERIVSVSDDGCISILDSSNADVVT